MPQIDVAKLNAAYQAALPTHTANQVAKQDASKEVAGFAGLTLPGGVTGAKDTFCTAWPKVLPLLNLGLKYLAWIWPAQVASAKAVLDALNKELIPFVCPK